MDPWIVVNGFKALSNTAAAVVAQGWTAAMLAVWNAGLWLLKLVLTIEDALLTPDLSQDGPMSGVYPYTFWAAGALVLILLMVQLGIAAVRRDGQSMARVLIGAAQFVMVWVGWVVYAVAVLAAAGGLTRALMTSLLHVEAMDAWHPWTGFSSADIVDGTIATVLGVMGFFLIFAAFAHLLVLLARGASLLVLAATAPISAAGLVWEGGRSWFWKSFRWFHAAAFTPVLMMLVLGVGVKVTSAVPTGLTDSTQKAIGTAVPGVFLILVGCFAPVALFKLLAFVDPGTSSGAAMRSGLAAQGGLEGLLRGSGATEEFATAASSSDVGGRSLGEVATESATGARFASAAGGLMGTLGGAGQAAASGLGTVAGAAARAVTLGADLTNQMGVGHNTYIPDFASNRSNRGHTAGPRDQDNPEINGAGPRPDASAPSAHPPAAARVSQPPTTGPPGGPEAGGAGAGPSAGIGGARAASGGGAAGGAAVVPVVPV